MILVPLLLAGGALVGAPDDPPPPPVVRTLEVELRVRSGRATVVQGDEIRVHTKSDRPVLLEGPAYLECGPGADVQVTWRGLSSLHVRGTAALEWDVDAKTPREPTVRIARFTSLDVEVRRGTVHLELPEGWALKPQAAALRMQQRPDEEIELRHHGGRPMRIISRVPRPGADWPRRLASGGRAVLPPLPSASSRDGS